MAQAGAHVLDADAIGHVLLNQPPVRTRVVEKFGRGVLSAQNENTIDRKILAALVFQNPEALRSLEQILHPKMRATFEKAIARQQRLRTSKAVVIDAAILLEAGWDDLCDTVVFVDAPLAVRRDRIKRQRGWEAEQLEAREAAQWPLERKRERADFAIHNKGETQELAAQIETLWIGLRTQFRQTVARLHAAESKQRQQPDSAKSRLPKSNQSPASARTRRRQSHP
jgi:dephospho-CoA kinase